MKRSVTIALGAMLLACLALIPMASAATEAEKLGATRKGLAYLYATQQPEGYWKFSGDEQAATGAAAFAFLSQEDKWGTNATEYQAAIDKAIAYLVSTANTIDITTRKDGVNVCFGGTGSCKGVYWFGNAKSTYTTGMVAPAIAAYGIRVGATAVATPNGPLAGMTWNEIAQAITNALAASQITRDGAREGGWGSYIPGNGYSDASNTQSAIMSLIYNETLGAVTPRALRDDLKVWLDNVQHSSGAACTQPGTEPCNHANTGSWLLAMKFVGHDRTNIQVQKALGFLSTNWRSTVNNVAYGNFGHPYAMWAVYRGLEATIGLNDTTYINNPLTDCGVTAPGETNGSGPCSWSEDYGQWLVKNQKADGAWGGYLYWTDPLAAAFFVNILGATHMPLTADQLSKTSAVEHSKANQERTTSVAPPSSAAVGIFTGAQAAQPAVNAATKLRPRERRGVTAIAVNGDGSAIASASTDKRIVIWSPTTGTQRLALQDSLGLPTGLAFSRGGDTLSSVGRDSFLRLWDGSSGRELAKLAGHESAIRAVAASPDDALLATAGEETRIIVWDQTNRKLTKILFGPKDFVNTLSFSPDSRLLASAGEEARVLIFDVATGRLVFTLLGHSGPIDAVAFSPNGTVLASAGQDTVIRLWDTVKGQQRQALSGHSAPIRTIAFSPDSRLMASAGEDTQIRLWNVATGAPARVLAGSTGVINALVFDPRGVFLASASEAGDITLWNVNSGARIGAIRVVAP